jgi:hypothetical protein
MRAELEARSELTGNGILRQTRKPEAEIRLSILTALYCDAYRVCLSHDIPPQGDI